MVASLCDQHVRAFVISALRTLHPDVLAEQPEALLALLDGPGDVEDGIFEDEACKVSESSRLCQIGKWRAHLL